VQSVALDIKNLRKFTAALLKLGTVRGPVHSPAGVVLADITTQSDLALEYENFKLPPKREFFPQCEEITRFDASGVREVPVSGAADVIFGVRPCDALALSHLDRVFTDDKYTDPYYSKRRDAALLISLACNKPEAACFCTSTGGSPSSKQGADIIGFNLGTVLLLEPLTAKGQAFVKKNKSLFRDPSAKELQKRDKQESDVAGQIPGVAVQQAPAALSGRSDPAFWESIAETCLSCGACTFLCPTCHCFDFSDRAKREAGSRLRVHDACMFASFVREASGHNPRGKKGERMRQRVMHKFSYAPENFNTVFCVGCGRCVTACPSNIDIRETLSKVTA
jgi:ferredoxin